ncbi:N-acyl amino acid synthase FeeM domain-containing protein [Devosia chinhatensis]|uniref:N-acyl amino acid synthase FeeM catalytic core domain-containing protein n=1 Tax=Devosia chinhatensis TaxID=429727 RepID=A0A0F5FFS7_9HYPH|nr:hypothetical protein [Devosia chinhatensis]KKB07754.1 hypothetical protein VE26_13915 [Devosia chinhatensis]
MTESKSAESGASSRFASTLIDLLDQVRYRRIDPAEQFDPVYRLRYEAYRREDFIPVNSQQVTRDEFDDLPNCYCYGVYVSGQLASSLRFHVVTPQHPYSPCMSVWPDVLAPILERGQSFIDPGRFTADFDLSLAYPALPYLTLRLAAMACEYFPVRYCMSAVRPEHTAFYKRIFGASPLGEQRSYANLAFPMQLYTADVPVIRDRVAERYPFFMSRPQEREALFGAEKADLNAIAPTARMAQRLEMMDRAG